MAKYISNASWNQYKNIIDGVHFDFNQDTIIWKRYSFGQPRYGEDQDNWVFEEIPIKGLMRYNYFQAWPINKPSMTGELDDANTYLILNISYLRRNNWLTPAGNLNYTKGKDLFIHQGIEYRPMGETPLSQAKDIPLHIGIILERQEILTGNTPDDRS
jgi:hypothetical protein